MFEKLTIFWNCFWQALQEARAVNKTYKTAPNDNTQNWQDTKNINFLAIFVSKLNNLVNIESTYEFQTDSAVAEPLDELCTDLETKRFEICEGMLGTGDMWVFPAHTAGGKLFHRYLTQDNVRVIDTDGDSITDLIGVIDTYIDKNNRIYFLNRRHTLMPNGTLHIETYTTDERYKPVSLEQWKELESVYELVGANHIGVGRFKSPASSRGKSPIYGVPLNYGCKWIEGKIFDDLALIAKEFKNAESKVFADPLILRKKKNIKKAEGEPDGWDIPENIFPIDTRGGTASASIDIFSPAIRYSQYRDKLIDDMQRYEQQVGTDRGFLTPFEEGKATTATEIRRANSSTIALIDRIHSAQKNGVEMTLAADAVFLNISPDLYSVTFDFFDAFEDTDKQYERIANAVDRGTAEKSDEMQWLFPNLTQEELEEKKLRIESESRINTDTALENLLNGGA